MKKTKPNVFLFIRIEPKFKRKIKMEALRRSETLKEFVIGALKKETVGAGR